MIRSSSNEYTPDMVSVPGETLQEVLYERGISQAQLAARTGRPKKTINEIVQGKAALTPETALQLERVLGVRAEFWNNLERAYRESLAYLAERQALESQVDWMKQLPMRAMIERGWIKRCEDKIDQLRELLGFFGVASPSRWDELSTTVAFRQSSAFEVDRPALSAWLRRGEIEGQSLVCQPYNRTRFRAALDQARQLTTHPLDVAFPELQKVCAMVGVAAVIVPELPRTRVNGATRWLSKSKALIQLSLRYKREDVFWFSFFHEAAHLLVHGKREVFVEGDRREGRHEEEADRLAGDLLVPPGTYRRYVSRNRYSRRSVVDLARSIGVHPGIVVGRLQHDRLIGFSHLNELRRPINVEALLSNELE
jgi:addiction module HigA family antidote